MNLQHPTAFLLPLAFLAGAALAAQSPTRDRSIYVDKDLLPREKQEEEARDRFLAQRKGTPYKQAEETAGRRLSLDFSTLERPHGPAEFKTIWHFPPKRQWWTNTCWSFSTTSFMESELKRIHGKELKLSEMFTVYWDWASSPPSTFRRNTWIKAPGNSASPTTPPRTITASTWWAP